jgi:hypothetical protein
MTRARRVRFDCYWPQPWYRRAAADLRHWLRTEEGRDAAGAVLTWVLLGVLVFGVVAIWQ